MNNNNTVKFNRWRMTPWEVSFIFICNIAFVLMLINMIIGGYSWCTYPIIALFVGYFTAFSFTSKTVSKLITRVRNGVFISNVIAWLLVLLFNRSNSVNVMWLTDYFVPISLITAITVLMILLFLPTASTKNILFSSLILILQSTLQLILMNCNVIAAQKAPHALVIVAFALNVIMIFDVAFVNFIKAKNTVSDKFKLWE